MSLLITAVEPATVQFSAAVEGGVSPYTFQWDFGDGTTGSGQTVSHTYAAVGTPTISVKVTDAIGNTASASGVLSITAPAPATIAVSPSQFAPGDTVSFSGSGFTPGHHVSIEVESPGGANIGVVGAYADSSGGISGSFVAPTEPPGSATVAAIDDTLGVIVASVAVSIYIKTYPLAWNYPKTLLAPGSVTVYYGNPTSTPMSGVCFVNVTDSTGRLVASGSRSSFFDSTSNTEVVVLISPQLPTGATYTVESYVQTSGGQDLSAPGTTIQLPL